MSDVRNTRFEDEDYSIAWRKMKQAQKEKVRDFNPLKGGRRAWKEVGSLLDDFEAEEQALETKFGIPNALDPRPIGDMIHSINFGGFSVASGRGFVWNDDAGSGNDYSGPSFKEGGPMYVSDTDRERESRRDYDVENPRGGFFARPRVLGRNFGSKYFNGTEEELVEIRDKDRANRSALRASINEEIDSLNDARPRIKLERDDNPSFRSESENRDQRFAEFKNNMGMTEFISASAPPIFRKAIDLHLKTLFVLKERTQAGLEIPEPSTVGSGGVDRDDMILRDKDFSGSMQNVQTVGSLPASFSDEELAE